MTEYDVDNFSRPRAHIRDLSENEREMLKTAALNEIHEWVMASPRDAANFIFERCEQDTESLLGWANAYHYDDEGAEMTLGFWPWKDDPIPAGELGITEEDDE